MSTHLPCDSCGSSDGLYDYESHTHCFSCGSHVFKSSGAFRNTRNKVDIVNASQLPQDLTKQFPYEELDWLLSVNLTRKLREDYGISYSPSWKRIIIPAFYRHKFLGWQGRSADSSETKKYLQSAGSKPTLFYSFAAQKSDISYVVIVEDAASAIRLGECGVAAVALLGTSLDAGGKQLAALMALSHNFVIWLDEDAAGIKAAKAIETRLEQAGGLVLDLIRISPDPKYLDKGFIFDTIDNILESFDV